jgi:hypothetical protein
VLGEFSILINQFESLSAFAAGSTRLSTFRKIRYEPLNSASRDSTSVTTISSWEKASLSASKSSTPTELIKLVVNRLSLNQTFDYDAVESSPGHPVLRVENLTDSTPDSGRLLVGGK